MLKPINKRFKELRTTLNLSQVDFGNAAGLTQSQVSQVESGARTVSKTIRLKLIDRLGVDDHWFSTGQGEPFKKPINAADTGYRSRSAGNAIAAPNYNVSIAQSNVIRLAERFKLFCATENLSYQEFKIAQSTQSKYETGRLQIPTSIIVYLHDRYHLSYEWFFNGIMPPKSIKKPAGESQAVRNLQETQALLVARLDQLEKALAKEKGARLQLEKELENMMVK